MNYLIISFFSGFIIMSVELIASRIVTPIIGNSIFSWTSVISVILAGISLGNYFGGKIIDKKPENKTLQNLIISAAIFIAATPSLTATANKIIFWDVDFKIKIILITALLFFAPSIVLGTIYPAAFKLYFRLCETIGESAGKISAVGALGSIVGTLATGFFFVGFIGSSNSLYFLSCTALLISLLSEKKNLKYFCLALFIIISFFLINFYSKNENKKIIYDSESDYYRIRIADGLIKNLPARVLFLDFDSHSIESLSAAKIGDYQESEELFKAIKGGCGKTLVIGGGSYNLPKRLSRLCESEIEVAEIDPAVKETAEMFFDLKSYPITTHNQDGRIYLQTNNQKYDLIIEDAYNSFISIPWHLATIEALMQAKNHLNFDGVYAINFISAAAGEESEWYQGLVKTFSKIFPNFYAFYFGQNLSSSQNIILVGINSERKLNNQIIYNAISKIRDESGNRLNISYQPNPAVPLNALILTDDFAPIERLMLPLIKSYMGLYNTWFYSFTQS